MFAVYVAGPYRASTPGQVRANVGRAADLAAELLRRGFAVICPHTMTHTFELYDLPDDVFLASDKDLLCRCDAVLLVPGWEASSGTLAEVDEAKRYSIPVCLSVAECEMQRTLAG